MKSTRKLVAGASLLVAVAAAGPIALGAACAGDASNSEKTHPPASVVRISTLRYSNLTVVAVVKMDRAIPANGTAFFADPKLASGETPGRNRGASPAARVGDADQHCYFVEARRLYPLKTPKGGSQTKLGFAPKTKGRSAKITQVVPARFARHYDAKFVGPTARRMGCGTPTGWE